ncbi:DUF6223 family protein [Allokutzneria albata]|uniref:Uncharacterized protein n=1 Tax=Allokutzneria albata TaxID=211114 RepID=A0A1G9UPI8_ALLAB|nr:DUF6223 family protein [Allokutzneria albata]SDM61810.1 hypothetical protein SAMN04489726_2534 [Allokutzneria albata]
MSSFFTVLSAAGFGTGRLLPTTAAVLGLISVIIGGLALARGGRVLVRTALVTGLVSSVVGGLHIANSAGGLGTGNGLAGAIVAVALGLIGVVVCGLALRRVR